MPHVDSIIVNLPRWVIFVKVSVFYVLYVMNEISHMESMSLTFPSEFNNNSSDTEDEPLLPRSIGTTEFDETYSNDKDGLTKSKLAYENNIQTQRYLYYHGIKFIQCTWVLVASRYMVVAAVLQLVPIAAGFFLSYYVKKMAVDQEKMKKQQQLNRIKARSYLNTPLPQSPTTQQPISHSKHRSHSSTIETSTALSADEMEPRKHSSHRVSSNGTSSSSSSSSKRSSTPLHTKKSSSHDLNRITTTPTSLPSTNGHSKRPVSLDQTYSSSSKINGLDKPKRRLKEIQPIVVINDPPPPFIPKSISDDEDEDVSGYSPFPSINWAVPPQSLIPNNSTDIIHKTGFSLDDSGGGGGGIEDTSNEKNDSSTSKEKRKSRQNYQFEETEDTFQPISTTTTTPEFGYYEEEQQQQQEY